jgi:hypothetical protein
MHHPVGKWGRHIRLLVGFPTRCCTNSFYAILRTAPDERSPGRWIGRGGPINWPSRGADLTSMDFVSCGYIRDIVHSENVESVPNFPALRWLWVCSLRWGMKWNLVST